ncbi:MAG: hypothetical protein COV57_00800 [Candidatus Liptonbacteria bacterium CG11_big_fil_rev_8_21_14_0_20_35_14]|uniref:Uncharacterized protein n=1 Tax=Candidatus Liptonbacteria bacterium CG11_big_fil_rev_8_21_14_0_20_35_14 TaxID=1974634 RepID=A0A2H0N891_9BACT|nr:MAG: hypothetical protein COV57_00800 [Candidatus Liptonbacteria bacterium CG11_big_fil_rev_8_21_14_0_20_35_14]
MLNSTITIKKSNNQKFKVEIDVNKLEKLANIFGLYNPDFIKSLEKSEKDYKQGKYKKIKSLKEL